VLLLFVYLKSGCDLEKKESSSCHLARWK
jgi:hypothetical protein